MGSAKPSGSGAAPEIFIRGGSDAPKPRPGRAEKGSASSARGFTEQETPTVLTARGAHAPLWILGCAAELVWRLMTAAGAIFPLPGIVTSREHDATTKGVRPGSSLPRTSATGFRKAPGRGVFPASADTTPLFPRAGTGVHPEPLSFAGVPHPTGFLGPPRPAVPHGLTIVRFRFPFRYHSLVRRRCVG